MAYCSNCGAKLNENAKFCHVCGAPVGEVFSNDHSKREQKYAGKLIKCPNCGELIDAFVYNCPSCGYEIRGASNSDALHEFSVMLSQAKTEKEKITIIRSFPIPNTKEDILEFMILASTNINENQNYDDEVSDAWVAKINQAYQKAQIAFKDQPEFSRVQNIYDKVKDTREKAAKVKKAKQKKSAKPPQQPRETFSEFVDYLPNLFIVVIWLISLFFLEPFWNVSYYANGVNSFRTFYYLDLFAGIFFIPPTCRCPSSLPKLITVIGLIANIVLMIPLGIGATSDTNIATFSSAVSVVIFLCAIIFIRLSTKKNRNHVKKSFSIPSYIFAVFGIVAGLAVYVFGTQYSSRLNEANLASREEKQTVSYEWPSSGISQNIPEPAVEYGEITKNEDSDFDIKLYKVSLEQYENYISECTKQGYALYTSKTDSYYYAYNEDRYYLKVSYDDDENIMKISLDAPMTMTEITWPVNELTSQIPEINYKEGNISADNSQTFSVYLNGVTSAQYKEYVDLCISEGFSNNYYRGDSYFSGENDEGYTLYLSKEKFDTLHIRIKAPKETDNK